MARDNNGFGETKAIRHRIEKIDIYEVTEDELSKLTSNKASDIYLEFAIALVSIFASFLCALLVADFKTYPVAFVVFLLVTIVTGIISLMLFCLWYRFKGKKNDILRKIRERGSAEA